MNRFVFLSGLIILVLLASLSLAEIPRLINYQGMLTQSGGTTPVPDDNYNLTFKIYGSLSGVDSLWWEYHTGVPVTNGLFNVLLGSISSLSSSIFDDSVRYLGIAVGSDSELSPRIRLTSVSYAYRALVADSAAVATPGSGSHWSLTDSVLYTNNYWGIARGGAENTLYGDSAHTMVNLGIACTTGTSGQSYYYSTVSGGYRNKATQDYTAVSGGARNTAMSDYATVGGGQSNTASGSGATVAGGEANTANNGRATVGGGYLNTASGYSATVGGGAENTAGSVAAVVGGGKYNVVAGDYSVILGGYADTITSTGDYSYLFGIGSKLTQDSIFMVDMPHIRFGDETNGYEFPTSDGASGQVMATNGSGQLSWTTVSVGGDNDWTFRVTDTADTTLMTGGAWGIARYGNTLYGNADSTHVNLGVACTTGTSGQDFKYCAVGGGGGNTASHDFATVGGGKNNAASDHHATVGGGYLNKANGFQATVGGGFNNTSSDTGATVGGGYKNIVEGKYSAILGGFADTITSSADYSYLFGIGSKLTQDSIFMVDMPHIWFGDESNGYEFPTSDGSNGQVMATNGSGQLSWTTVSVGGDNDWTFRVTDTADTTLMTGGAWGIARYGNTLYGNADSTHVNLGVACTTGASGQNYKYCTIGGGLGNTASEPYATVGGGNSNTASWDWSTVGGGKSDTSKALYGGVFSGYSNLAGDQSIDTAAFVGGGYDNSATAKYATVCGGEENTASGKWATVGGGWSNTASQYCATIGGGYSNTASSDYATVSGGGGNVADGYGAIVGGGVFDTVSGDNSFAAGSKVRVTSSADYTFAFGRNFTTATPNAVIFYNSDAEIKIGIDTTSPGNIITVKKESATDPIADAWTNHSSIRWKENINPIEDALDKVLALRGVYFDWKESKKHDIGMIAEEVGEVIPEVVVYEENGVDAKSLDYARLTTLLVEAIKEQQKEIELLKVKINTLEKGIR